MSDIQTLNYTSHAIEDIKAMAQGFPPKFAATAAKLRKVTLMLDQAVKFLLPDNGDLVDFAHIDAATMDLLRLPFPLVVLEVPFPPTGSIIESGPMKETSSSRRIVLAWDESFAARSAIAPDYTEPGVYVVAVYYTDETREWVVSPVGLFMPRDNDIRTVADGAHDKAEQLAVEALLAQAAITQKSQVLDVRYFDVLPQLKALMSAEVGEDVTQARMQMDVRDEMLFTWGFCVTVNCVNVAVATVAPPEKLNAKRIRNGKPPLYEYKVLELPEPRQGGASAQYRLDGLRQGPRQHLRRGHPRRLQDGRVTYVRAAVIGTGSLGTVQKDYRVPQRKP